MRLLLEGGFYQRTCGIMYSCLFWFSLNPVRQCCWLRLTFTFGFFWMFAAEKLSMLKGFGHRNFTLLQTVMEGIRTVTIILGNVSRLMHYWKKCRNYNKVPKIFSLKSLVGRSFAWKGNSLWVTGCQNSKCCKTDLFTSRERHVGLILRI